MAEWFWWFMDSWWSTGLACACVLVLAGLGLHYIRETERLRDKYERKEPSLYELFRRGKK